MKAYSYLRVSGASQVEKDGFPRQREAVARWAEANGATIAAEFAEKGVGGDDEWQDRPAFSEMVGAILGNGVRIVIVENLSRLARAYVVQEHVLLWLASKEITLIAADSGEDITAAVRGDPVKKLVIQMMGILYEYEKNSLVRKLAAARKRKAESDPTWSQGRKPFGARPGEQATIARLVAWRAAGRSYGGIAKLADWAKLATRSGKPWSAQSVRRILKREEKRP